MEAVREIMCVAEPAEDISENLPYTYPYPLDLSTTTKLVYNSECPKLNTPI